MAGVKKAVHEIDFAQTPVEDLDRSIAKTSITLAYFILELTTLSDLDAFHCSDMIKHKDVVENIIIYMRRSFEKYCDSKTEEVMKVLTEHIYNLLDNNLERKKGMNVAVGKTINNLLSTTKQSIIEKGRYPDKEELVMLSGLAEAFAVATCLIGEIVPICFDTAKLKLLIDVIYASEQSDFIFCTAFSASMRSMDVIMEKAGYEPEKIKELKDEAVKVAKELFPKTLNFDELLSNSQRCIVGVTGSHDEIINRVKSDQSDEFDVLNIAINGATVAEC